jgi:hypothetical protein
VGRRDPDERVVVDDRLRAGGDEGDLGSGDAREDLVGAGPVEQGESVVEADGDLHGSTLNDLGDGGKDAGSTDPAIPGEPNHIDEIWHAVAPARPITLDHGDDRLRDVRATGALGLPLLPVMWRAGGHVQLRR